MEVTTALVLTEAEKEVAVGGAAIGGVLGIGIGVFLTAFFVLWIFQIIAFWKIFTKAGEPGWKSIIPIYNGYVQYKITWKPMWFWIYFVLLIVNQLLAQFANSETPSVILIIVALIVVIALLVVSIISMHKMSKSFGHGVGFTIGLILLYPIFVLILGYGKSEYKGADL